MLSKRSLGTLGQSSSRAKYSASGTISNDILATRRERAGEILAELHLRPPRRKLRLATTRFKLPKLSCRLGVVNPEEELDFQAL